MTYAKIKAIAERTQDAYSYPRYVSWIGCVILLSKRGLDERQIEAILRSKWMRYAADNAMFGDATSGDLRRWLHSNNITQHQIDALTEHFGEQLKAHGDSL